MGWVNGLHGVPVSAVLVSAERNHENDCGDVVVESNNGVQVTGPSKPLPEHKQTPEHAGVSSWAAPTPISGDTEPVPC